MTTKGCAFLLPVYAFMSVMLLSYIYHSPSILNIAAAALMSLSLFPHSTFHAVISLSSFITHSFMHTLSALQPHCSHRRHLIAILSDQRSIVLSCIQYNIQCRVVLFLTCA